jgi:3-hydroxyacyl-CoA dehydrogenase
VAALLQADDRVAAYARRVMGQTLAYAASLIPEIHDDPAAIDEAVRLGYNWKQGPFELIDAVGAPRLAAMLEAEGEPVPAFLRQIGEGRVYRVADGRLQALRADGGQRPVHRPEGVLRLADVKRRSQRVAGNGSASLWDLGDGVACLEFHTKMNAIDDGIMAMIHTSVDTVAERFRALVLHNEGSNFSAGANLGVALFAANIAAWERIERMVQGGQEAYRRLRYAPFPVVGAPAGMALGGGCEVLLHCDGVQAHMESYLGLVEPGVGVIPAWGGCTRMLARLAADPKRPKGPMPPTSKAFETISVATVAKSAEEAREHGFLQARDRVTMNRERVLAEAKAFALELAEDYRPPEPAGYVLPGPAGKAALDLAVESYRHQGKTTPHDLAVADRLATVLSGGAADPTETCTEEDLLALERRAFMQLIRTEPTLARIEHMLETGQPLRN